MKQGLLLLIRAYRYLLSPLIGRSCRFWPSCSAYSAQAIEEHGAARGTLLTAWRIARCVPWCEGGVDPVPDDARLPAYRCICTLRRSHFNVSPKKDDASS
jgi:uncharacterized protein